MLYAIVAVLVIIVDQWVKYWVAGAIAMESTGETFIPGLISLVNLHNDGAAFSFLSGGGAVSTSLFSPVFSPWRSSWPWQQTLSPAA